MFFRRKSPVVNEDNSVTFFYANRLAKKVAIAGTFNDWHQANLKMNESGIWEYTTGVLGKGLTSTNFKWMGNG